MDDTFEKDMIKVIKRKSRYRKKLLNILLTKAQAHLVNYYRISWDKWYYYVQADLDIIQKQYEDDPLLPKLRMMREIDLIKNHIKDLQKTIRVIQNG